MTVLSQLLSKKGFRGKDKTSSLELSAKKACKYHMGYDDLQDRIQKSGTSTD